MKQYFRDHWKLLFLFVFLINLFLVFYDFLPNLSEINGWDEAKYINQGRLLLEGHFPTFADNPFLSLFYGVIYPLFSKSPYWLVQSCSLGRFLLFCLNWLAAYFIAKELKEFSHPLILLSFFLISPLTTILLTNPSDGLFASLSGFSFWKILQYLKSRQPEKLLLASFFIGLSALSRNDGVILWVISIFLVICFTGFKKQLTLNLLYSTLPFIFLVGGYLLFYGSLTGDYSLHIQERSYTAFEQGHEIVFTGTGSNSHTINAMLDSRTIYGTAEENHNSFVFAILRNPSAYFSRLQTILAGLPVKLLDTYNKKMAVLIFLLALRGIYELVRKKEWNLLILFLIWPAYLLTYFFTFFREGYLRTPFFIVFALAAIGLSTLLSHLEQPRERGFWSIILIGSSIYGIVANKLAIFYGASLFLIVIWFSYWLLNHFSTFKQITSANLLLFLCVGLILRGNFASPRFYVPGNIAEEKASKFMMDNIPKGSLVLAGGPEAVWEAKMEFASLIGTDIPNFTTGDQFLAWLNTNGFQAVYLDFSISRDLPIFWDMIQEQSGKGLQQVFSEDDGSIRIYFVNPVKLN